MLGSFVPPLPSNWSSPRTVSFLSHSTCFIHQFLPEAGVCAGIAKHQSLAVVHLKPLPPPPPLPSRGVPADSSRLSCLTTRTLWVPGYPWCRQRVPDAHQVFGCLSGRAMLCIRRQPKLSQAEEFQLLEESRKVAALNGKRLGKGLMPANPFMGLLLTPGSNSLLGSGGRSPPCLKVNKKATLPLSP